MADPNSPGGSNSQKPRKVTLDGFRNQLKEFRVVSAKRVQREALFNERAQQLAHDGEIVARDNIRLREENERLQEQLESAQSKIFSLQPYIKELTPKELGTDFDNLLSKVELWVRDFMEPWLENQPGTAREHVLDMFYKRPSELQLFREADFQHKDLVSASFEDEVDEDIVFSPIMRYLQTQILQSILLGFEKPTTAAIEEVHTLLRNQTEPQRDPTFVRNWWAEAYSALLAKPHYREFQQNRIGQLTQELARTFAIFCPPGKQEWFLQGFEQKCIRPSVHLHDKLSLSIQEVSFTIEGFIGRNAAENYTFFEESFWDSLEGLNCIDIYRNRKKFHVSQLGPQLSHDELKNSVRPVCAVSPALLMRRPDASDGKGPAAIVRRQSMLVASPGQEGPASARRQGLVLRMLFGSD